MYNFNRDKHECMHCDSTFNDELSKRVHQYWCDPNPDMFVKAWRSSSRTGFYADDPYY